MEEGRRGEGDEGVSGTDYEPYTYSIRGHGTCTCDGFRNIRKMRAEIEETQHYRTNFNKL